MGNNVYIGIGSNIEPREEYILKAIKSIKEIENTVLMRISSLYETEPVGYREQNWFLNAAIMIRTEKSVSEFFDNLKRIEKQLGRKERGRWMEREIDLDILFYGDMVLDGGNVTVPHPQISNRKFVLRPLCEIGGEVAHPVTGEKVCDMLKELELRDNTVVRKRGIKEDF